MVGFFKAFSLAVLGAVTQAADLSSCPGYKVTNIKSTNSTLTADLTLAGEACSIYAEDLRHLRLAVEYETSMRL